MLFKIWYHILVFGTIDGARHRTKYGTTDDDNILPYSIQSVSQLVLDFISKITYPALICNWSHLQLVGALTRALAALTHLFSSALTKIIKTVKKQRIVNNKSKLGKCVPRELGTNKSRVY